MCLNTKLFNRLIAEVGEWSAQNFGLQKSKWKTAPPSSESTRKALLAFEFRSDVHGVSYGFTPLYLDHVAPLLGIIEEFGELSEADRADKNSLVLDSIGDVQIYLADYLYRCGLDASYIEWDSLQRDIGSIPYSPNNLMDGTEMILPDPLETLGQLTHINLKRHQGIRGYDGDKFFIELRPLLTDLMRHLRSYYLLTPDHPLSVEEATNAVVTVAMNTWEHVKQRNWKKSPESGS